MKIQQTLSFKSKVKKLHKNQLMELEGAVNTISQNPMVGIKKKGALAEVYVYKFKIKKELYLLAYTWDAEKYLLTLLQLGVHKNFYRDLK